LEISFAWVSSILASRRCIIWAKSCCSIFVECRRYVIQSSI
jgi:hypothetical protein